MSKKASTFLSMTLTLFVTTLVAGVSLGFINDITKGPKARAKLERKINALRSVLPEFNNNPVESVQLLKSELAKDSVEVYTASLDENEVGTAIVGSSEKGFSGLVKIMVGFNTDGSINNIEVLEQKETPGLGTKMKDEKFIRQFKGKHPSTFNLKVKKDQGDVDALTGATITTRAFGEATQMAYDIFEDRQTGSKQ
ncbi:RnfABCDGE type electron transport complex subunit G [Lutimonas sp.]|uniref:RnfABCDGE type electron transport complex subunit G n=1 Tax=Lutimonas sp. TaxID=1872403 RepID=UPI003D9AC895